MGKLILLKKHNCTGCELVDLYLTNEGIHYHTYDVEAAPELAAKYEVMSVPVLLKLDDEGEEVDRIVGYAPDAISQMIE